MAKYTKLHPIDIDKKVNEFLNLFSDKERKNPDRLSAKEKCDLYGIEVKPYNNLFNAYYMKDTKLFGGNNKEVYSKDRTFPILNKKDMTNWVCFYEKNNHFDAENLYKNLNKASKAFGVK